MFEQKQKNINISGFGCIACENHNLMKSINLFPRLPFSCTAPLKPGSSCLLSKLRHTCAFFFSTSGMIFCFTCHILFCETFMCPTRLVIVFYLKVHSLTLKYWIEGFTYPLFFTIPEANERRHSTLRLRKYSLRTAD